MLNQNNVVDIVRETKSLLCGDKGHVSRALRRFLQRVVPDGIVTQAFSTGEKVLGLKEFATYEACAKKVRHDSLELLPENVQSACMTQANAATGAVANIYPLDVNLADASVAELRDAVFTIKELGEAMLKFAKNPVRELYKFTEEHAEEQRLAAEAREQAANDRLMKYLGWM